jgi:hypothetical protein
LIALRNGLSAVGRRLEAGDNREDRLAFRAVRRRIEQELGDLSPTGRGRSVAWILDIEGNSERYTLQLPLRGDKVVADTKPYISPLVDVVDRGARTGVILVSGDLIRLVQVEQAEATEPPESTYELSLGDWRPFGGSAGGSPARGLQPTAHEERYRARVEAQQDRLFETAATQTAKRLEALGWERIVIVSQTQVASRFREALPAEVSSRVIAESDSNLIGEEPAVIADAIEPLVEEAWQKRANTLVELARDRARAGGTATLGAQETFGALTDGRVEHLILDPDQDFSTTGAPAPDLLEGPIELLGERAVEAAIATSAEVTAVPAQTSPLLGEVGGIAALLRY